MPLPGSFVRFSLFALASQCMSIGAASHEICLDAASIACYLSVFQNFMEDSKIHLSDRVDEHDRMHEASILSSPEHCPHVDLNLQI